MHLFFKRILIGYIFIFVDLNIGIDFVPDIVGYFIIGDAVQKYAKSKYNNVTTTLAYILGANSVLDMRLFEGFWTSFPDEFGTIISFSFSLLLLAFYYYLFEIFLSFVIDTPHVKYTEKVKYSLLGSMWLIITLPYLLLHVGVRASAILLIPFMILTLIAIVMFFIYCYKMMKYGEMLESQEKQKWMEQTE